MTGGQLKDELARIADGAPEVHVPDDTFARGRRATMRARALVAAAAVACIAAVAGIAVPIVSSDRAPFADGDAGAAGVPDRIYARSAQSPDLPEVPLDEVGPLSAAYQASDVEVDDVVVAVTTEGRYRQIVLPNQAESITNQLGPLLSPDGTMLAYVAEDLLSAHLAIVDLTTGDVRRVDLLSEYGALVGSAQWSPDGDWLVWSGQRITSRDQSGRSFGRSVGGVVRVATATSRRLPSVRPVGWEGAGICNDGAAVRYVWPYLLVTAPTHGTERVRAWSRLVADHGDCAGPGSFAGLPTDSGHRVLGWLPGEDQPTAVAVRPHYEDGEDESDGYSSLDLVLVDQDGEARTVGRVDAGATNVTIASGFVTAERPTVPAGPSPWAEPWITEHWIWLVGGLLAAGLAAGLAAMVAVRARAVRR